MDKSWVKTYRKMVEWEWYSDLHVFRVFMHLILTANYEQGQWQGVVIQPGQKVTSLPHLAKETGLSIQQARTALAKLKSTGEITDEATNKYRLITIKKWSEYQASNRQTNRPATDNQQTDEQASNSNIRIKEIRREEGKNRNPIASSDDAVVKKEKKSRKTLPHYSLIEYMFELKGWERNDVVAKQSLRPASDLLHLCDGNVETAREKIRKVKEWADLIVVDWNLNTVLKRWFELDKETAAAPKKPYIENCPAYQKHGDWWVINPDGTHVKWIGPLNAIKYA